MYHCIRIHGTTFTFQAVLQKADINYADWHTTYINGVSNGKISQMSSESVKETTGKLKITRGFIPKDIFNLAETLFSCCVSCAASTLCLLTEAESGVKDRVGEVHAGPLPLRLACVLFAVASCALSACEPFCRRSQLERIPDKHTVSVATLTLLPLQKPAQRRLVN